MHKASKRTGASFVLATAALSLFALHCSSEDDPPAGVGGTAPVAGSPAGGTAAGGTAAGGGGAGGSAVAGSATGGGGAGGSAAGGGGAGGSAAGGGGAGGGGAGGAAGGGAGGGGAGGGGGTGGATVTFAQVRTLLGDSCATGNCHNAPSDHIDFDTEQGLYMRLTMPIGANGEHCKGSPLVVPGNANDSLLAQIVKMGNPPACKNMGGQTEMVNRMPFMCGGGPTPCLTDPQIKIITDWIAGGAPQ